MYKPLGYCCHCHVHQHTRSKIKEKVATENFKDKSRDSITNKDTPVNIALGPKDKDTVEKKDQRNAVLWRYFGFLKSGTKLQALQIMVKTKLISEAFPSFGAQTMFTRLYSSRSKQVLVVPLKQQLGYLRNKKP